MPPNPSPATRKGSRGAPETAAVGAFLRAMAERAEREPAFGRQITALLAESGLLALPLPRPSPKGGRASGSPPRAAADASGSPPRAGEGSGESSAAAPLPDPFAVLREHGEAPLRECLAALDLAALRQIVRAYRLDPARISARWTVRERLIALIVDQVRARANHGKAFSRV